MSKNFRYSGDHDFEEYHREKNKKCTEALLASLIKHHGEPSKPQEEAEPVELVAAVVADRPKRKTAVELWLDTFEPPPTRYPTISDIKKRVAEHFGITVFDLDSPRRTDKIVLPRQIAYYLAKKLTPRSLPDIARKIGDRDHSSIHHGIRKIEGLLRTDLSVAHDVAMLEAKFT